MCEIWSRDIVARTSIFEIMALVEKFFLMDKHFRILTSSPRPNFSETCWMDPAYQDNRLSLWFWCTGLAHEYFGVNLPENLHEFRIEWFDEVVLRV